MQCHAFLSVVFRVRSDPDQVREWQNLRRGGTDCNDDAYVDLVDAVLQKDELSRENLKTLQEHKRSLKLVQSLLRPPKTSKNIDERNANDREDLIKEKKIIEEKIKLAEKHWKSSLEDTTKTLFKLASPVTNMSSHLEDGGECGDNSHAINIVVPPLLQLEYSCPRSSLAMDLEQAWKQYTLHHFASYLWLEVPPGVPVVENASGSCQTPSLAHSISPDRAHELWGCYEPTSLSQADSHPIVMLPSWIRLLTDNLPSKSIWGEKELPRYTAIWSRHENYRHPKHGSNNVVWLGRPNEYNDDKSRERDSLNELPPLCSTTSFSALDLVAVVAPSAVDAREIQWNLVKNLVGYFGGLFMARGDGQGQNQLLKHIVAAPHLHNHELSRIEIHFRLPASLSQPTNRNTNEESSGDTEIRTNTLRLGWVSHWGDAMTRACDMAFSGGGVARAGGKNKYSKSTRNTSTKEYVHLVQASVIDDSLSMWNKILYANSNAILTPDFGKIPSSKKDKQLLIDVPPVLVPYLIRSYQNLSSIPIDDFFLTEKSKRKNKETVFGTLDDDKRISISQKQAVGVTVVDRCSQDQPRFPPLGVPSSKHRAELREQIQFENFSCPYDFLFD